MTVDLGEKVTRLTEVTSDEIPMDGYIVYCERCDAVWAAKKKRYALWFSQDHRVHSGHKTPSVIHGETFLTGRFYRVDCEECDDEWVFDVRTEAEDFIHEHALHLDHSPDPPRPVSRRGGEPD